MNPNPRLCRQSVAWRPKARRHHLQILAVGAAVFILAAAAALTLRQMVHSLPDVQELGARLNGRIDSVAVSGAPELLQEPLAAYLHEPGLDFSRRLAELPERFAALRVVRVRRDWLHHSARVEVRLRTALGRAALPGRAAGFVDEDGSLFAAPQGLYPEASVVFELGAAAPEQRREMVSALGVISRSSALPAPLKLVRYAGGGGWELALNDGSRILWGDLRWTAEKLDRLGQALSDARRGFPGACVADLRYFEDGRLLIKPLGSRAAGVL